MTGCQTCAGFGDRHDPVAHGEGPVQPDYLTEECWTRYHDMCGGYTADTDLCECQCHDDRAAEYEAIR